MLSRRWPWRRRALVGGGVMVAALAAAGGSHAHGFGPASPRTTPACAQGQFQAQYFDNTELLGTPILTECHDRIDGDWGLGRAHPRVPEDRFSVRWTGQIDLMAGTYRMQASSDDGARVYVDGDVVIDAWRARPLRTSVAHGHVDAGRHEIVFEYFDSGGLAVARLQWERSASGWFPWPEELSSSLPTAADSAEDTSVVAPP